MIGKAKRNDLEATGLYAPARAAAIMLDPLLDFGRGCVLLKFYGEVRVSPDMAEAAAFSVAYKKASKAMKAGVSASQ